MVVVNLGVKSFPRRIREKLLEVDLDGLRDVGQAAPADTLGDRRSLPGDEDTLVHGFEAKLEFERRAGLHAHEAFPELLRHVDRQRLLAHLARPVHQVADAEGVGIASGGRHEEEFYPSRLGIMRRRRRASRTGAGG